MQAPAPTPSLPQGPSFNQALRFWFKLGLIGFGGPAGQIAIMHQELVEKKKWISSSDFLHALNFCMLLPGPEAQQLATYIGWRLHRIPGGLVAGILFILPSALILWILSWLYVLHGQTLWLSSILHGLNAAAVAIIILAVFRIGKKVLKNPALWLLAATAFASLYFFHLPFPVVIIAAGLLGFLGGLVLPKLFLLPKTGENDGESFSIPAADSSRPSLLRNLTILLTGLSLWLGPVAAVFLCLGKDHILFQQSVFFGKAALVTFGGAYAVLPYVAQQAVETFGWLSPVQMITGLSLAETTPGPLIMVLQFVGFVGAWNHPEAASPFFIATLAAALTTWVTFVPSFLWIFLGAPYMEKLRGQRLLCAILASITAAVVGVILNLALWFALHTLWREPGGFDFQAGLLTLMAGVALGKFKIGVLPVILACGLLSLLLTRLF